MTKTPEPQNMPGGPNIGDYHAVMKYLSNKSDLLDEWCRKQCLPISARDIIRCVVHDWPDATATIQPYKARERVLAETFLELRAEFTAEIKRQHGQASQLVSVTEHKKPEAIALAAEITSSPVAGSIKPNETATSKDVTDTDVGQIAPTLECLLAKVPEELS